MRQLLGIGAATTFIVLCTLLPFFPGRYDRLAVPLSAMAQMVGTVGLVLVPIGILWMVAGRSERSAARRYVFAFVAVIGASLVAAVVSLIGIIQSGFVLGLAGLTLWGYAVLRVWPKLMQAEGPPPAFPLYFVAVPVTVSLLQLALVGPAVEFSRGRAIRNSAPIIAAIERYYSTHGRYPPSLLAVWPDYSPGVIGIEQYLYEPTGEAYNLLFEQFTYRFGTREFVMYNPRDEHAMTSHAMDLLRLTAEQLAIERTRGHYALHDTAFPNWKRFLFD
jgi:hypothetical protein